MDSIKATAFFSRPFDKRVEKTVSLINALCTGIDVSTCCVDNPSPAVPSAEANDLIAKADFLIALCSRVHKIEGKEEYLTSTAVREEIAAAQALGKKVVFFFEDGVKADGFAHNRATSHIIKNAKSLNDKDIEKILKGIHSTKLESVENGNDVFHATGIKNFHISKSRIRYELKITEKGLVWEYTIEKAIVFEESHDAPITSSAFCIQEADECSSSPNYKLSFLRNGKEAIPDTEVSKSRGFVRLSSKFNPSPKVGEEIIVREKFQSPYLAQIYSNEKSKKINLSGKSYEAYDGIAIIHRTYHLNLEFIIPEEIGLMDISPVVATFSNEIDYINEGEIEKIISSKWIQVENFGGSTIVKLLVDRPLYQYFYGIAWNCPERTEKSIPLAKETEEWL